LGRTCSGKHASLDSKAWSRGAGIAPTVPAGLRHGSKSITAAIRRSKGSRSHSHDQLAAVDFDDPGGGPEIAEHLEPGAPPQAELTLSWLIAVLDTEDLARAIERVVGCGL